MGDLLLAFVEITSAAAVVTGPAAWTALGSFHGATSKTLAVFAKVFAAGDTNPNFGPAASGTMVGVIIDYGTSSAGGAALPVLPIAFNATENPTNAPPALTTWQNSQVVAEFYATQQNVALTITANVNSPTTRASLASANGSLLVVDYRKTTPGSSTNDTGGTAGVNGLLGLAIGVGA